jgi:glycosyltransferase involved in cell wall biosynthesis
VKSALNQDYDNLEIIISDDCSSDSTYSAIVESVRDYTGGKKIRINRNDKNLGIGHHVNKIASLATGDMLVFAAGDDISVPHRCRMIADIFSKNNNLTLIHSRYNCMNLHGQLTNEIGDREKSIKNINLRKAAKSRFLVMGASCAWNKRLFTEFPPILHRDCYEDLVLAFRAVLIGKVSHIKEPLIFHRQGGISDWKQKSSPSELARRKARREMVQSIVYKQREMDLDFIKNKRKDLRRILRKFHKKSQEEMRIHLAQIDNINQEAESAD